MRDRKINGAVAREAFDVALETHRQDFGTFFLARLLDLDISYGEDVSFIRFPVRDFLFNPQGSLHGGVIGTVLDIAMGHLLHHSLGVSGATLEMKVQFTKAVLGPTARAEGRFLRKGHNLSFLEARLWDADDGLAAVATSTWKVNRPRPPA